LTRRDSEKLMIFKAAVRHITGGYSKLVMRLPILIFVLALSGCGAVYRSGFVSVPRQPISGPVSIGPEWVEIIPPEPLIPYGTDQEIVIGYLDYDRKNSSFDDTLEILNLSDGRKTKIEAVIFDDEGKQYELQISGVGGVHGGVWFTKKGEVKWSGEPNFSQADYSDVRFPQNRSFTKLKMRSEIPLNCEYIEWVGVNPK